MKVLESCLKKEMKRILPEIMVSDFNCDKDKILI